MSERELTTLLDRAAAHTPPMDVSVADVVGTARGRRRRRRLAGTGMALTGLVLAGGLWWGLGPGDPLGSPEAPPAGTDVEPVEGEITVAGTHVRVAVEEGWVRADDEYYTGWHIAGDLGSGVVVGPLGDGWVALARVPDGTDPQQSRLGRPGQDGVGWVTPESSTVLDIPGEESVVVLALPEPGPAGYELVSGTYAIGLEGEDSSVHGVPSPLASSGAISFWAQDGQVAVTVDGRPVPPSPQVGPAGETMFDAGPAGMAFAVPHDDTGAVTTSPVVRDQGRVQVADAQLRLQRTIRVGSQSYLVGVLDPGVEVVAVASSDEEEWAWSLLGDDVEADMVVTETAGRFWLFPQRGLWLQQTDPEHSALRGGEVGAGLEAFELQDGRLLFGVVPSTSKPTLTVSDGMVLDGAASEVAAGGLVIWSQAVPGTGDGEIQRDVRGLDLDGDGTVEAPLVTHAGSGGEVGEVVSLLGEPFEVTGGGWSWPTLTHVDDSSVVIPPASHVSGDLVTADVTGVRWGWEEPGTVFFLSGVEARDEEWLTFRLADGSRLEPRDRYTLRSWRGPTTVLTLPPGVPVDEVELVAVAQDGAVRPVP